jgi:hypothetical protein
MSDDDCFSPSSSIAALRAKARKCRRLADAITDPTAVEQLTLFADELETEAQRLDANLRAAQTHSEITRQALAELKHTSASAKLAVRRARAHRKKPKATGRREPDQQG